MGRQEIYAVFVWTGICTTNRSRAIAVHQQSKTSKRSNHEMGDVPPKL